MDRFRRHLIIALAVSWLPVLLHACPSSAHDLQPSGPAGAPISVSALGKAALGIKVQPIERKSIPMEISVPGKIEVIPTHQFDQHAPLSGRVFSVSVAPGQMVREGQVLAVIESPEMNQLAAQLLQSRLDLESEQARQQAALDEEVRQAEERYRLADANLKRVTKLHNDRIAAMKDVLAAQSEYNMASTRVNTAKQNRTIILNTLKRRLDLTLSPLRQRLHMLGVEEDDIAKMMKDSHTITQVPVEAARSGFITAIAASPGKSIDPSVSLFTIADLSKVWATADVYEDEMSRMRAGQHVHVKVHALQGEHVDGVLTFVGTQVDPATRTLPVRAELNNSDYKLKPDMFAELFIETSDTTPIVSVPHDAVVQQSGHSIVFLETADGYQPQYVKVGRVIGDQMEIASGLRPGDKVVVQGAFQLGAEMLKASGGEAMFASPSEGERMDEEQSQKPKSGMTLSIQSVIVIVAIAFLLGFAICAAFLFRARSGAAQRNSEVDDFKVPDATVDVSADKAIPAAGSGVTAPGKPVPGKKGKTDHV